MPKERASDLLHRLRTNRRGHFKDMEMRQYADYWTTDYDGMILSMGLSYKVRVARPKSSPDGPPCWVEMRLPQFSEWLRKYGPFTLDYEWDGRTLCVWTVNDMRE